MRRSSGSFRDGALAAVQGDGLVEMMPVERSVARLRTAMSIRCFIHISDGKRATTFRPRLGACRKGRAKSTSWIVATIHDVDGSAFMWHQSRGPERRHSLPSEHDAHRVGMAPQVEQLVCIFAPDHLALDVLLHPSVTHGKTDRHQLRWTSSPGRRRYWSGSNPSSSSTFRRHLCLALTKAAGPTPSSGSRSIFAPFKLAVLSASVGEPDRLKTQDPMPSRSRVSIAWTEEAGLDLATASLSTVVTVLWAVPWTSENCSA